ncbi:MAG: PAS domain-containing sensor histidine kinase [Pseudomonadota bacterium]|nr:PAS domain-containing sensor histidine kinase [Pseudomonadota bacterium]
MAPLERTRQESFVLRQVLNSLATGAAASVCVAINGPPAFSDALVFIWLIFPASVLLLSSTGKLMPAEAMSSLRFIAAGLTAAFGGGALHPTAFAWLIIAPVESVFSMNGIVVGASATLAAVATLLLGATSDASGAPALGAANTTLFLIPATVFATSIGTGFVRLRTVRRKAKQVRTGRYESLAETMGCLVLCCDRSGAVASVSSNCEALFGLPPSALTGRGFFERVQVADRPAFLRTIADTSAGSVTIGATLRWRGTARVDRDDYAEPVFLWLEMRARRGEEYRAAQGESQDDDVVAVFRDVTEAKLREAALENARAAAEEANLAKDYFLAQAGHELRTPLNAIAGFSELLGDPRLAPPDPETQREYARIIYRSGRHLLAVVNSILDLSKIQSGSLAIEIEPFAVAPLIDLCCDMAKLHAKNNGVELLRAYPANLEEITGDRRVCTQILVNLLSNAIKFTPAPGSVTISARPETNSLLILVADTGIGIAASDLARLGDPFFQAKALPDRQDEGTGLGLSIVRGLVGLQGGTIMVASEPGKGTSVRVRLPLDCRGLAAEAGIRAKIETIAHLPVSDQHDLYKQMTVKKIA